MIKKALPQRIFFSIGFLFLLALVNNMGPAVLKAQEADQYTEANCLITKNEWKKKGDGYALDLEYSYMYQAQAYTGTRYMWGLNFFENQNRQGAKEFVKRATVGTVHSCYVNPLNPSESVIYKGIAYEKYEMWAIIIFILMFGWGFIVSWFFPNEAEKTFIPADPS